MRIKAPEWTDKEVMMDQELQALLFYAPEAYPNITDADDMLATILYIMRVAPYDDWTEEDTFRLIAEDWPDEDAAEIRAFIAAEPHSFAEVYQSARAFAREMFVY